MSASYGLIILPSFLWAAEVRRLRKALTRKNTYVVPVSLEGDNIKPLETKHTKYNRKLRSIKKYSYIDPFKIKPMFFSSKKVLSLGFW